MIIKRNFNPLKVVQYVKAELLFSVLITCLVFILEQWNLNVIRLPFSITAILGSALAIFIAFRNNTSYSRWWEARTQWSGIVNSSRVFARLIITFTDSHVQNSEEKKKQSSIFKREMLYTCIAWAHALRMHLREQDEWDELNGLLTNDELKELSKVNHKPNFIHLLLGKKIYKAMGDGTLAGFDSFQLEGQLLSMANYQGACERIKNTPLLRQYDYFTRIFLFTFIFLLPFTLVNDFVKMQYPILLLPVCTLISFIFAIIGKVGEVNEDPFENKITDVPLTSICNTIERDLKEMLGEESLPKKVQEQNGFIY